MGTPPKKWWGMQNNMVNFEDFYLKCRIYGEFCGILPYTIALFGRIGNIMTLDDTKCPSYRDMNIDFAYEMFYQICDRKLHQNWQLTPLHPSLPENFESLMIQTDPRSTGWYQNHQSLIGLFKASCGKTWFCMVALKNP